MTAVEFLESQYKFNGQLFKSDFQQAKAMEKEQIMNAWDDGQSDGATICTQKADNPSEQYYNETFKSE